jgi:hypothetical protein
MRIPRAQIARIGAITIICFGVMSAIGLPVKASQPVQGVANWLQSLAGSKPDPQSAGKLRSLRQSKKGINELFKKASQIISRNNKNLKFPQATSPAAIHQILLIKWHQHKAGNSMSAVPLVKANKFSLTHATLKLLVPGNTGRSLFRRERNDFFCQSILTSFFTCAGNQIVPLVNEISIGAP